ncbi:succinylglutamate desuccinylase [Alteromonas sp. a30]|uniref:succinylglutamate desuccinylase n=1 Tax=Alteromonas sp. a30 TaxID=2730917 RepID=UPI0022821BC4|nr:succinylglutamate desuccinylase [Alteromonas sp. a30]MCY7296358.1 succinylglutamate desuccinylase [Alteromonas sp. a30]
MSELPAFVTRLQQNGDFLSLSRQHPQWFSVPISFVLDNQTHVSIPAEGIIIFEPAQQTNKDIIYSCGIHGNETAPIEICDELVAELLMQKRQVTHRLMVIFGNLPAMDIAQRFVEENLNRLFDGEHSNPNEPVNAERLRAKQLEACVRDFYLAPAQNHTSRERFHYDLHTAIRDSKNEKFAVYPFTHGRPRKPSQVAFMGMCGVKTILLSDSPTTTFSYFSCKHFEADAFTVELGKVRAFGENDMSRFEEARQTLFGFATDAEFNLVDYRSEDFLIYKINQIINRGKEDFSLNFAEDEPNFSDFKKGEVLAQETGTQYIAEQDGEAIVFPNAKVAIGQRALLTVVPCELY